MFHESSQIEHAVRSITLLIERGERIFTIEEVSTVLRLVLNTRSLQFMEYHGKEASYIMEKENYFDVDVVTTVKVGTESGS